MVLAVFLCATTVWGQRSRVRPRWDPIESRLRQIGVEEPRHYRNLTLFPLVTRSVIEDRRVYLTLDQALDRGDLILSEVGSGRVNEVIVQNRSDRYVFLMSGEIISGGKQDRMISEDTLLPPNSPKIALRVYCVEHGRWVAQSSTFGSKGSAISGSIRGRARMTQSQQYVWDSIEIQQRQLGVSGGGTRAFQRVYDEARVQKESRPYLEEFDDLPARYPNAIGVVVGVGGRILTMDVFANTSLFRQLWPKLLKSYVVDAMNEATMPGQRISREDVQRLLLRLRNASRSYEKTPGVGDLVRLRTSQGGGSALLFGNSLIHLDFFPGSLEIERSPTDTPSLRFRRERHQGPLERQWW